MHQSGHAGFAARPADDSRTVPAQRLPQGHPSLEQWTSVLPEGHPPLMQRTPQLPEGHPPIPGYLGDCPASGGGAPEYTDEPAVDAQQLIST
jgi:hypothetical protein